MAPLALVANLATRRRTVAGALEQEPQQVEAASVRRRRGEQARRR